MVRAQEGSDLHWREVKDVLVILHGRAAPTDERWRELVLASSAPLPDGGRAPRKWSAVLIYSFGGMPTFTQRATLGTMLKVSGEAPPVALVSNSPMARGVLTAVRWILPSLRSVFAFSPEQRGAALEALGLQAALRMQVDAALEEMLVRLRPG